MVDFTHYHAQYLSHRVTLNGVDDDAFAKSLSTARVQLNPHQVDAALFALAPPVPRGAILADEVGLGKTIEASLVIAQRWAEKRRRILLIAPASLRKQWTQELSEKFGLDTLILESKTFRELKKAGVKQPFEADNKVVVTSYEFAAIREADLVAVDWDLVVFDEAHRLRNVYKQGASKRAKALQRALKDRFKLLLTATPLQNSLMELYGLVSIVDEKLFGDEVSFKVNYGGKPTPASLAILRDRLKPICLRTLRKDVQAAGHINYTKRISSTFTFEPHDTEVKLYDGLSRYLQRKDTIAFGAKPNQLVMLVIRKILGSSTFAVADTLTSIIDRLKKLEPVAPEDLADIDTAEEIAEEWTADDEEVDGATEPIDPEKLKAEIEELTAFRDLARSIRSNAKGEKLVEALAGVLDDIESKKGQRKAVIFTESVRTQKYLFDLLSANGYQGQIALMNGQNKDATSVAIYEAWKARHAGSDALSGSRTADMKAAIVEAFKNEKTILIATESGAEGINLQFCSLLINFDLPWNPQRVEQRIGRCHRYGQSIDVMVINLLNLKNRAEERVLELLQNKFHLFDGVFGASDEVLGAIENGTDFAKRVFEIQQNARTNDEIDAAFNQLRSELEEQIKTDIIDARGKLIGTFDKDVVKRLADRKEALKRILDDFEERLIAIARAELPEARFYDHDDGSPCFVHEGQTWTTGWPLADEQNWRFFRLADGNLAQTLVDRAKGRTLPLAKLVFDYSAYTGEGQLSDIPQHIGRSGWLKVSRLSVSTAKRRIDHMVLAATTDDGVELDERVLDRLFRIPATTSLTNVPNAPEAQLAEKEAAIRRQKLDEAERFNAEHLTKETDKLDAYAEDLERAADAEIKALEDEIKLKRKEMRAATGISVADKVDMQRAIKKLEAQRDDQMMAKFERKKAIRKDVEDLLDEIQASLKLTPETTHLFTIRWELRG
ncbi:MAG: DEAD/DEAH box helicase family protein [Burkholderiales bacterium]|nr:DEAD/DEAH box helicase family protein [Burkholderiales bacterium]